MYSVYLDLTQCGRNDSCGEVLVIYWRSSWNGAKFYYRQRACDEFVLL